MQSSVIRQAIPFGSPEVLNNPYPTYQHLQETAPVYFDEGLQTWVVTRYEDVFAGLKDNVRFGNSIHALNLELTPEPLKPLVRLQTDSMVFSDPPRHTRLRNLIHKAFTPNTIQRIRGFVQEATDQLLDEIEGQDTVDIKQRFAYPLPIIVIAELLGVEVKDREMIKYWGDTLNAVSDPAPTPEILMEGVKVTLEMEAFFNALMEERTREPREDLLTLLVEAGRANPDITPGELFSTCVLLLSAGYETTTNVITNGMHAMLKNKEQWELLKAHPDFAESAVEEFIRYDASVQLIMRIVNMDTEIRGVPIPKGDKVAFFVGAANRDPRVFENPNKFDICRSPNQHLTFSHGIHFCVGAPLARLETSIVAQTFARRLPNLRLAAEPEYQPTILIRSPKQLVVHLN